jgi:CubicO group peptidase (beta-lactamase class C family)
MPRLLVHHLVIGLLLGLSGAVQGAPLTQAQIDRIDAFVESERVGSRIPGIAWALVDQSHIAHVRGFGTRGAAGQPVARDTPFPVGSLGKSFTAVLARQLAETGQLDLDAPLQRVLPAFNARRCRCSTAHHRAPSDEPDPAASRAPTACGRW